MELKKLITLPYNIIINSLNYFEDMVTSQPKTLTYDDVKIAHELKEERMTFEELVLTRNYPLEIHYVDTEDGYILKLFRIPGGKGETNYKYKQKQSVLLMHGIYDSSDTFVCNSEEKCIPFILANLGYDIWLGNNRGNKHSKHHKKYATDSFDFWNFSFHEMGLYDLPAFLNHITKINKFAEKVVYMGHSQGTAQLFAALTQKLEYFRQKIKLYIALGPVGRVYNMNSRILRIMEALKVDRICERLNFSEMLCSDEKLSKFSSWIMPKIPQLGNIITNLICDINSHQNNNQKMMSVYWAHQPGGSSLKAVNHFVQLLRSKKFRMYDYGEEMNMAIYHQSEPKEYDLKVIYDIPIALLAGRQDKLSTEKDVEWLKEQLGDNVVFSKYYDNMGHTSFTMAENMEWFNKDVIELMDLYC